MGVNILFGSSSASKDKCFLLLPIVFLAKSHALSLALRLGSCWAHFSWAGRGLAPRGRRSVQPGSRGQGSCRVTPHPTHCAQGLEVSSAYAGSCSGPAQVSDRQRSPSIVGIHSRREISFSACFYHLNSNCDKNGSQRHLGYWWTHFQRALEKET